MKKCWCSFSPLGRKALYFTRLRNLNAKRVFPFCLPYKKPPAVDISILPQDRFLCFSSVIQCFLVLFCQPKRTFSCSRALLFPCSPLRTMVRNVVKTRTSKKHKWSPQNRSKNQVGGGSRKEKTDREKTNVVIPKATNRNMWSRITQTAWSSHVVESYCKRQVNVI